MLGASIEPWLLRVPRGAMSRLRLLIYRGLGMKQGKRNRMEGGGRVRRCSQISIGVYNAFTQGCWLWPEDTQSAGIRIRIGNSNEAGSTKQTELAAWTQVCRVILNLHETITRY